MKKLSIYFILIMLIGGISIQDASAQGGFLRKLKKKAEDKAVEKVFGEDDNGKSSTQSPGGSSSDKSSNANSPQNTKGEGLTTEAPDVMENIDLAQSAFSDKQFAEARFSVRQAIMGIELEIGQNILNSFPESIQGLPALKDEDQVASTGIGFVGLVISRTYRSDDKQFSVTVGNESALLTGVNMYLAASGSYATSQDENHKTIKIGEHRAVIEYDASSGYTVSVPIGQSSILVAEGINFETESDMRSAVEQIDIDKIKKELGE